MYTIHLINIRVWAVKRAVCPSLKKETCPNKFDINIKQLFPLSIFTFQLVYMDVINYTYETYDNNNIIIISRHTFDFQGVTYRQFLQLSRKITITIK